jgi:hypothetical protein
LQRRHVLCLMVSIGVVGCSDFSENGMETMSKSEMASLLAMDVARLRGLKPEPLGPENQVAYGTLLLKYVSDPDRLVCAILISHDDMWDGYGEKAANAYLRATAALSDPNIGGLFDTGGGAWMFDRLSGKTYLFRAFPLNTSPAQVNDGITQLARVAPAWVSRWQGAVARIAHGREPPPRHPVTLANDPYAGRL